MLKLKGTFNLSEEPPVKFEKKMPLKSHTTPVAIPPFRAALPGDAEGGVGFGVGGGSLQPIDGGEVMSRSLLEVDWPGRTIDVG